MTFFKVFYKQNNKLKNNVLVTAYVEAVDEVEAYNKAQEKATQMNMIVREIVQEPPHIKHQKETKK